MNKDKCPFCGIVVNDGGYKMLKHFIPVIGHPQGGLRSSTCYETQLAAQAALLRRCEKVVRMTSKYPFEEGGHINIHSLVTLKELSQALLPDLEAYKEGKVDKRRYICLYCCQDQDIEALCTELAEKNQWLVELASSLIEWSERVRLIDAAQGKTNLAFLVVMARAFLNPTPKEV